MTIKEKKYLSDIKRVIALIRAFVVETKSYSDYEIGLSMLTIVWMTHWCGPSLSTIYHL